MSCRRISRLVADSCRHAGVERFLSGSYRRLRESDGVALLIMLVALVVTAAFTGALVLTTVVETRVAASGRDHAMALSAADAIARRALLDLMSGDWDTALGGGLSTFTDGPPSGPRTMDGGVQLSLDAETFDLRCGRASGCDEAEIVRPAEGRPWGTNNPRWQLFAYGPFVDLLPEDPLPPRIYLVAWISDDPSESDADPLHDGAGADNPGQGLLLVTGRAYGPGSARGTVQLAVERVGTELRVIAWHTRQP